MSYQDINQHPFNKFYISFKNKDNDLRTVSDMENFDKEIPFSEDLIANSDGERLPIKIDFNSKNSIFVDELTFGNYNKDNIIISENYMDYSKCESGFTICDIGLTGIDNGLVEKMSGETILITNVLLDDSMKFHRTMFDKRMKFFQVTGYTATNNRFSGNTGNTIYDIITKTGETEGVYQEFYGGFYQGFYKLFGYEYQIIPERMKKGWTVEFLMKPRITNFHPLNGNNLTLNDYYPTNKNTFFYMGSRAENKFYHYASKTSSGDTKRVTDGLECLMTCSCDLTGITNSNCISVYPSTGNTTQRVNGPCDMQTIEVPNEEKDPILDSLSNALSFKLCGDPSNPRIGIRVLRYTGACDSFNPCEDEIINYSTGYTVDEHCTPPIYSCISGSTFMQYEHWFLLSVVFERDFSFPKCSLYHKGGLGLITRFTTKESLYDNSLALISPPLTHEGLAPDEMELIELNKKWLTDKNYRNGKLKIFINGYPIYTIENFEEIIPRPLNDEKERQVGVPFNISIGGGTQGFHDSLTFINCNNLNGPYQQDPELLSDTMLNNSSFSGLTNNLKIEEYFAGNFEGAIAQFRMYVEPLSAAHLQHNFRILKDKFSLFDYFCDEC